jgi:hypothetical protein
VKLNSFYQQTIYRLTTAVHETQSNIVYLASLKTVSPRIKRGWFDFIGKGAKTVFGLATSGDIHILANHIEKLKGLMLNNNVNRISDIEQLHSFQVHASDRIDKLAKPTYC